MSHNRQIYVKFWNFLIDPAWLIRPETKNLAYLNKYFTQAFFVKEDRRKNYSICNVWKFQFEGSKANVLFIINFNASNIFMLLLLFFIAYSE